MAVEALAMQPSRLSLQPVNEADFEAMLAIRIEALRPSLERLGRFDPTRARERFRAGFVPQHMRHIALDCEQRIGFITLKPQHADVLRLDHLYLRDGHRGAGVGSWAIEGAKQQAGNRAIEVSALRHSEANRFYLRHGFVPIGEEPWDLHYRWQSAESRA